MNIDGFQILEQLGDGPLSAVWKAHQTSLNRIVAIKVLKQRFAVKPNEIHPVLKEARTAAGLKHPNIIAIYDAGELDGLFYFVMEYVAGSTIGRLIEKKGVISQPSTLNAALLTAEALDHAWKTAHIVHRGINPDNIMIDADGTVKVADLGLPKLADPLHLAAQIRENSVRGKLNYISPEQAKCSIRLDFHTDMYGLGATLYHMVTGRMPFHEFAAKEVLNQHLTGFLTNPRDIAQPTVSAGMAQLIAKLMIKDHRARYADWSEVVAEIKKLTSGKAKIIKATKTAGGAESPVSTIAASTAQPPPKPSAIPTSGKTKPRLEIPWYVWVPVWTLFAGWWSFLAWSQLRLPPLLFRENPPLDSSRQVRETQPSAPAQSQKPATPPKVTEPAQQAIERSPIVENPEGQNEQAIKAGIAGRVCTGDMEKALAIVEQEMDYPHSKEFTADLKKLREILNEADHAVESALLKKLGQEIVVNDQGHERHVTVRGMTGGVLSADYKALGNTGPAKSMTIPVAKLDAGELIRCIGDDDTPGKSLMKYSLYLRKGERLAARKTAAKCGPLADLLAQAAEPKQSGNDK